MAGDSLKPDLNVPDQKIASLSFCEATPRGVQSWVKHLPMANVGEASRQLYHAIIELNQLFAPPQQRLQFLELLRPKIHFVCRELSRHYLGLAVALPEKQRKIANLSQALELHLANGYKLCLMDLVDEGGAEKTRKLLSLSCHRAISDLGATILRAQQLYCPSPARSWLECHRIYQFAAHQRLLSEKVSDDTLVHHESSTVADAYKRILLLGCSRPNQLRQNELVQAYNLFESWTRLVHTSAELADSALYVINMERDAPPIYRTLLQERPGPESFGFDTADLSERIAEYLYARIERKQPEKEARIPVPDAASDTLLTHLSQALGVLTKRNFNRITSHGTLQVCVGLSAAHFFIAGDKPFSEFLAGNQRRAEQDSEQNVFMRGLPNRNDAWAGAHDVDPSEDRLGDIDVPITFRGASAEPVPDRNRPRSFQTKLVNTSPGGYCISWEVDIPPTLQAGEVLGVREHASHPWSVALVRWIRQIRGQGTRVGLELLAPSASPCAAQLIQKTGNSSEYLRCLLLPAIDVVNQPATVITPRLPFQPGSRISLIHDGTENQGQLTERTEATGSISQFELRLKNPSLTETSPAQGSAGSTAPSEDEFDSLWPSL